jgi:hypothetical protein
MLLSQLINQLLGPVKLETELFNLAQFTEIKLKCGAVLPSPTTKTIETS